MPEGISPNSLNPLSQVYLDSIAEGRLKSLEKASALSASDNPDDQDEARKIRVRHDYESLKQQIGKKKKPQKPAVAESVDFSHWRDDLREIVGGASPILSSNPAVSSEPSSNIHATDTQTAKKVTEKKVKNKIKINPEFKEAVEEIGGQLLEVKEVENNGDEQPVDSEDAKQKKMQKDKETMLKKRIIRMKLRAVNIGADQGIVASYQPEIEGAVQYFYEQGINEEGLDQIIEEIGLDEFVNFVLDASQFLTEETEEGRPARKMNVRTLKSTKKRAAEIKADRSDVVKRGTPVDTLRRARAERSTKKPKLAQPAKPAVVKSVAKVKKTQPAKKPNKQSLRDRVGSAFKKGVERHKAAVSKNEFTKGVASGVKAVGKAVRDVDSVLKVNKKKTVNMQSYEPEGEFIDEDTKRTTKGRWVDKKGRSHKFSVSTHTGDEGHVASIVKSQYPAKRVVITGQSAEKKKKVAAAKKKKKLEEGEIADKLRKVVADMKAADRKAGLLPGGKDVVDLDVERERRRKKKVEEEVGISSSVAMEKARKEAELRRKEEQAVKKEKKALKKEEVQLEGRSIFKKAMSKAFGKKKEEERKAEKAQDAGARLRRKKAREEYASKVSGSEDIVPDDLRDHYEIAELNRYEKEKGKSTGSASYRSGVNTPRKGTPTKKGGSSDKIIHFAKGLVRGAEGRPTGQTRKSYDARGKETDRREKPSRTMERIRQMRKDADKAMRDTSGT